MFKKLGRLVFTVLGVFPLYQSAQAVVLTVDDDVTNNKYMSSSAVDGSFDVMSLMASSGYNAINGGTVTFYFTDDSDSREFDTNITSGWNRATQYDQYGVRWPEQDYFYDSNYGSVWVQAFYSTDAYVANSTNYYTKDGEGVIVEVGNTTLSGYTSLSTSQNALSGSGWDYDYQGYQFVDHYTRKCVWENNCYNDEADWYKGLYNYNRVWRVIEYLYDAYRTFNYEVIQDYTGNIQLSYALTENDITNIYNEGVFDYTVNAISDLYFSNATLSLDVDYIEPILAPVARQAVPSPSILPLMALGLLGFAANRFGMVTASGGLAYRVKGQ